MKNAVLAEFLGTGFLLVSVVGSGIMAETLAGGNIALALLANAIATGCMLYCIITLFGAVSGRISTPLSPWPLCCAARCQSRGPAPSYQRRFLAQ